MDGALDQNDILQGRMLRSDTRLRKQCAEKCEVPHHNFDEPYSSNSLKM